MPRVHAEEQAEINATAEAIYPLIADYHNGHPKIAPPENFPLLEVESGGVGEGTIIRIRTRVMGQERSFRQIVHEPEPGRVLTESDIDGMTCTTFTLTPLGDGQRTLVRLETVWDVPPGFAGWMERWFAPRLLRQIYRKELALLAKHAEQG